MLTPAERAEYERLLAASDAAQVACRTHPVPPPEPGSRLVPKGCTCFTRSEAWQAFMSWESPECQICGGRARCNESCDAIDRRR